MKLNNMALSCIDLYNNNKPEKVINKVLHFTIFEYKL